MEIGSISECITAVVAVIGVFVSIYEYKRANRIKRSSYLEPLIEKLKNDEISQVIYMFQYGKFNYDENFHNSGELEWKVDKALQYLSYLCYLRQNSIISAKEFSFFEIEISQTLRNKDLINYLYNLYHYVCKVEGYNMKSNGLKKSIYSNLLVYGRKKGLIDDSFFDSKAHKSGKYNHYLNY